MTGVVSIPLIVAGPSLVRDWLPVQLDFLMGFYWPAVLALSICFLATLYHVSVPVRTNWTFNLPGATFSLACWILGSYLLRWFLTATAADSRSIYGPLAAPIAVLLWLYLLAIAVSSARRSTRRSTLCSPRRRRRRPASSWSSGCAAGWPGKRTTPRKAGGKTRAAVATRRPGRRDRGTRFGPCRMTRLRGTHAGRPSRAQPHRVARPGPLPVVELGRRMLMAPAILIGTVLLVYFDRTGYRDGNDPPGMGARYFTHRDVVVGGARKGARDDGAGADGSDWHRHLHHRKDAPVLRHFAGSSVFIIVASMVLFDLPMRGSWFLLLLSLSLYLAGALGLGLMVSTLAESQEVAFQIAVLASFLPTMMLSGFVFPIASMPQPIQALTFLVPARYFIVALRAIVLKGAELSTFWLQLVALTVYAVLMLTLASKRLARQWT